MQADIDGCAVEVDETGWKLLRRYSWSTVTKNRKHYIRRSNRFLCGAPALVFPLLMREIQQ